MSINYRILKACNFSPRHTNTLINELNALRNQSVANCAMLLGRKCKDLSIADFPNPFPHDEDDHMMWENAFLDRTPPSVAAPPPPGGDAPKGWPGAWGDTDGVAETPIDPDAPADEHDPNVAPGEGPLISNPGPLEEILGDSSKAGQPVEPATEPKTPPAAAPEG